MQTARGAGGRDPKIYVGLLNFLFIAKLVRFGRRCGLTLDLVFDKSSQR